MTFTLFKRSLAQDDVDRYNHTWAVALLSLLAFVFLLLPFGSSTVTSVTSLNSRHSPWNLKVTVACWMPAQFTRAHTIYVDTVCTKEANKMILGFNTSNTFVPDIEFNGSPDSLKPATTTKPTSPATPTNDTTSGASAKPRGGEAEDNHSEVVSPSPGNDDDDNDVRTKMQELVNFRTPLVLFLLAVCLKLPQIVWSLLKDMTSSCIDVHLSLESCLISRSMDVASQRQVFEKTSSTIAESTRQTRNTASVLYLFLKLFTLIIILIEIFFIGWFMMTDIHALKKEIVENPFYRVKESSSDDAENHEEFIKSYLADPSSIYHCTVPIRQISNRYIYSFQCVLNRVEQLATRNGDVDYDVSPQAMLFTNLGILLLYEVLFTGVLASLVILAIANIFNTITWLRRLTVSSYATSMGLPSNAAKDVVLLVHMAWLNAGPMVARGLTGSSAWSGGLEETNTQPMSDYKA